MMRSLLSSIEKGKVLISDGAWGTFLHQKGLQPGKCPELRNISRHKDVLSIAKSYIDAGADIILTNSFGGSLIKLAHNGLQNRAAELNEEAANYIKRSGLGRPYCPWPDWYNFNDG
ncbi:MAG: homocysteine S-methyltransferase family protein [Ignavibacteriaceae bacterium]